MRAIVSTDLLKLRYSEKAKMSATEWYEFIKTTDVSLAELQGAKIDQLNETCEKAILAGFTSDATKHSYTFSQYDQLNFTQQMLLIISDATITSVEWKTADAGTVTLTREEFLEVCKEAEAHKRSKLVAYWNCKSQVLATTTKDQVDAIAWA